MRFEDRPEYVQGHNAELTWVKFLAARGDGVIVPVYGATDVDESTKAPVLFVREGKLVSPDVLYLKRGVSWWHEVKSKSAPSWRRTLGRWEHGIDLALIEEYQEVEKMSGLPLAIIVHEVASPEDASRDSALLPSSKFLWSKLSGVQVAGEARPEWPGGRSNPHRRGRGGRGGWLWPRQIMQEVVCL